jgi:hypothetical protein
MWLGRTLYPAACLRARPGAFRKIDLDYQLTVLSGGCLDADAEVHRGLTEKVFPRQAEVVTIEHWTPRQP